METFLNRYRNITVLLLVIFAQLVLLAVQVKNDQDVRMIRVWTVTAVTPVARIIESLRGGSSGFVHDYILLRDTHEQNQHLQEEVNRLKLENNYLKNELNTADRAKALAVFQARTPSKFLAANVIGTGAGNNAKVVFVDRGSAAGVQRGMAVVTPDGIVGKVIAAYPTASEVLLITDPDFAAGVISQGSRIRATLKGQGTPLCKLDYVPFGEKIQAGETLYTSGDDRIFPRGMPAGVIKTVRPGQNQQEIWVQPTGFEHGLEDVLILIEGVHQDIPNEPAPNQQVYLGPAPPAPAAASQPTAAAPPATGTDADKLRAHYLAVGEAQGHKFGEGGVGTKPPDFNLKLPANAAPAGRGQAPGVATPALAPPTPGNPAQANPSQPKPATAGNNANPAAAQKRTPPPTAQLPTDDVAQRPHSE